MRIGNIIKKASAVILTIAMLCTSSFALSIDFAGVTLPPSNQDQTSGIWTLDMDDTSALSTTAGVEAGSRTALVIRTGDDMGAEANTANGEWNGSGTALGSWFDYGANGNVMVDEYDFSFTPGSNFQVRGYSAVDSSHNGTGLICHAFSIENNKLKINEDMEMKEWPTVCDITPNEIHTMRLEINNQSSPYTTKFYLDGQLVYTKTISGSQGDNSKAVNFLLTTPNSEARIYRFARNTAGASDVEKRNFCKTFDGMTERDFWKDYFCVENLDGWSNKGNGHTFALEVEDSDTKYMKLKRTGAGGNGHVRFNSSETESMPKDLNIDFSYWGLGLNQIRIFDRSYVAGMLNIVDNQLVWGTNISDNYEGIVIKDFVEPFKQHRLTLSLKDGNIAIYLDNQFLYLTAPYDGDLQVPNQIRFYNMSQLFVTGSWGNANRHMYAGIAVKSITTDNELLIDNKPPVPDISVIGASLTRASNGNSVVSVQNEPVNYEIKVQNEGDSGTVHIIAGVYKGDVLYDVVRKEAVIASDSTVAITDQIPGYENADELTTKIMIWDPDLKPLALVDDVNNLIVNGDFDKFKVFFSKTIGSSKDDKYEFTPACGVVEINLTLTGATDITVYDAKRKSALAVSASSYSVSGESLVTLLIDTNKDCYDLFVNGTLTNGAQLLTGSDSGGLTDNIAGVAVANAGFLKNISVNLSDKTLSGVGLVGNPTYSYNFSSTPSTLTTTNASVSGGVLTINRGGKAVFTLPKAIDVTTEISFKFKTSSTYASNTILVGPASDTDQIKLTLSNKLQYKSNSGDTGTAATNISSGSWHTLSIVEDYSRAVYDLRLDGTLRSDDATGTARYFQAPTRIEISAGNLGTLEIDDFVVKAYAGYDNPSGYSDYASAPEFKDLIVPAAPTGNVYYASDMMLTNYNVVSNSAAVKGSAIQVASVGAGKAAFVFDGEDGYYNVNVGYIENTEVVDSSYRVYSGNKELDFWYGKYDDGGRHVRAVAKREYIANGDLFYLEGYSNGDGSIFDYIEFVKTTNEASLKGTYIDDQFWNNSGDEPTSWVTNGFDSRVDGNNADKGFQITAEGGKESAHAVRRFNKIAGDDIVLELALKASSTFNDAKIAIGNANADAAVINIGSSAITCGGLNVGYPTGLWKGVKIVLNTTNRTYSVYSGTKKRENISFEGNATYLDRLTIDTGRVTADESNLYIKTLKLYNGYLCNDDFKIYDGESTNVLPQGWSATTSGGTVVAGKSDAEMLDPISLILTDTSSSAGVTATRAFESVSDKLTASFMMSLYDGLSATLGDVTIKASGGKIYCNDTVIWDNYKTGLWYRFTVEEDLTAKTSKVYVNNILKTTVSNSGAAVSSLDFATGNSETITAYVDDVCIENDIYVSPIAEPVPADTGDYDVAVQACDLWREGNHFGWDKIRPYDMVTPLGGYYDDGSRPQADLEIKWMTEHGVSVYLPCWYSSTTSGHIKNTWYADEKFNAFLSSPYIDDMQFALAWENSAGGYSSSYILNEIVPYWIENYFKHPSYYMVDGNKPLILIYHDDRLKNDLSSEGSSISALFNSIETLLKNEGFGGAVFVANSRSTPWVHERMGSDGYDYTYIYSLRDRTIQTQIELQERINEYGTIKAIPTMSQGWGDEPWGRGFRKKNMGLAQWYGGLKYFKEIYMPGVGSSSLASKMLILDNWNEWGEGHALYPSNFAGFSYLDAVKAVFAEDSSTHTEYLPGLESDLYIH